MCALASVAGLAMFACGGEVSAIVVDVDIDGYRVPEEIDTLHFELSDTEGVFVERTYELISGETSPSLSLKRGERTPRRLTLVIFADHQGTPETQSAPTPVVFVDGEVGHVHVTLTP